MELRDFINEGLLLGPRLTVAPWWVTMTGGHGDLFIPKTHHRKPWDTADGPDACRALVRLQVREGADFIKVIASGGVMSHGDSPRWPNYSVRELEAIVDEAHTLDMKVAAHAHSQEGIRRCLDAGVDSIEHGTFAGPDELQRLVKTGTAVVPTLSIIDWLAHTGVDRGAGRGNVNKVRAVIAEQRANFTTAFQAGANITMGTDSAGNLCPFGENARELELYVELGMPPHRALQSATIDAAKLLGRDDELGSVTVGKLADLIIVEGNPLDDITLLRRGGIRNVILNGNDISAELSSMLLDTNDLKSHNYARAT